MFRINSKQFEKLGHVSYEGFVNRTATYLSRWFPAEVDAQKFDIHGLKIFIREGVTRARFYNVVNEADVIRFIECMLLLGKGFDDDDNYPWARETLRRPDRSGVAKMDLIDEHRLFSLEQPLQPCVPPSAPSILMR